MLLEVSGVTKRFGGLVALNDVSLTCGEGEIKGLIGPNGSGKTTLVNVISGLMAPDRGWIRLDGQDITGLPQHRVAGLGVSRTYQKVRLFPRMSVLQNVMVGCHRHYRQALGAAILRTPRQQQNERAMRREAEEALAFVGLAGRVHDSPGHLPYGHQRLLEIARALATRPRLLLLDEPAAGLNTQEKEELARLLRRIRERGITMVLIDHDLKLVMSVCDSVVVLNSGVVIAQGLPREVQNDPRVIESYLGEAAAVASGQGESGR